MTATAGRPADRPEIGRDRRRKEDQRLITGRTRWTDNITLPGMLHLAMVRSPFAHAKITNIDTEAAKAAPNVVTVITGADLADEQGVDAQRLADHPRPGQPRPPADRGRPGRRSPARSSPSWSPARPPRPATRPSSSTSTTRSCPRRSTSRRRPQDTVLAHPDLGTNKSRVLEVRLGRGGHRRQRRRGDREGPWGRHRHRAGVPPATADPGLHGAPLASSSTRPGSRSPCGPPPRSRTSCGSSLAAVTGIPESKIRVIAPRRRNRIPTS